MNIRKQGREDQETKVFIFSGPCTGRSIQKTSVITKGQGLFQEWLWTKPGDIKSIMCGFLIKLLGNFFRGGYNSLFQLHTDEKTTH